MNPTNKATMPIMIWLFNQTLVSIRHVLCKKTKKRQNKVLKSQDDSSWKVTSNDRHATNDK